MPSIDLRRQRKQLGKINEFNILSSFIFYIVFIFPLTTDQQTLLNNNQRIKQLNTDLLHVENYFLTYNSKQEQNENRFKYFKNFKVGNGNFSHNGGDKVKESRQKEISDAMDHGIRSLNELIEVKEPYLYKLGFFLNEHEPAAKVASFGSPKSPRAHLISQIGYATLEASKKLAESLHKTSGRQPPGIPLDLQSRLSLEECPFNNEPPPTPRCSPSTQRYRTFDGTCNNFEHPSRGSALIPMQRFLPPVYEDGIQSVRLSVFGTNLASPRQISTRIHSDRNREIKSVTLMFTQWGQFIDHDLTSTVKSRGFNGSIPRCCEDGGRRILPLQFLHPSCLPIEIPRNDPFFSQFGLGCMEFIRSSPSTTINCELGWREQINQVTSYLDASTIYGSDRDVANSMRTFRNGMIFYGSQPDNNLLDVNLCKAGAVAEDCMQPGDSRLNENPGLIALHTVFVRYHNRIANILSRMNAHWNDEKVYQETRRIVVAVIQHITYKEYLPIVVGPDVMDLFDLRVAKSGYYEQYDPKVNPTVSNSFSTVAFRFGHSMVQNSFIRSNSNHQPLPNNVTFHEEFSNHENIWSPGSVDRLLLGFINQPSQKRDEFISNELTNHLFQFSGPFGMDLAAINIQRARDHGIPPYTYWREPCGLTPVKKWSDLDEIMNTNVNSRIQSLYSHVDDIDLFTAGLAEKPLRGGVVGPTFACIIAQQFQNLRKGDRFWYENQFVESAFSPMQLQEIRKVSLSQVLCETMDEFETVQPFVFLSADSFFNIRVPCRSEFKHFDLAAWRETPFDLNNDLTLTKQLKRRKRANKSKSQKSKTTKLIKTTSTSTTQNKTKQNEVKFRNATNVLESSNNNRPLQVNINIQVLHQPTNTKRPMITSKPEHNYVVLVTPRPTTTRRPFTNITYPTFLYSQAYNKPDNYNLATNKPQFLNNMINYASVNVHKRPNIHLNTYRPTIFEDQPFSVSNKPTQYYSTNKPLQNSYSLSSNNYFNEKRRPQLDGLDDIFMEFFYNSDRTVESAININDKLDF
ncbi:hypothetical protein ABEB36_010496 [Hypothenemus hampei]|uniref:Peroxidase n=1 Tax=Hypothenemus hampei TaxID=57062 RepID=A0ABD1EJX8_HYPHA